MENKEKCGNLSAKRNGKREDQGHNKSNIDGGWAWAVCLGALIVNFLTVGQQNSAGVLYSVVLSKYSTQRGETGENIYSLLIQRPLLVPHLKFESSKESCFNFSL